MPVLRRPVEPAVKTGNTRSEPMSSALPPTTDMQRPRRHVRVVPMSRHRSKQRYLSGSLAAVGEAAVAIECETEMRS